MKKLSFFLMAMLVSLTSFAETYSLTPNKTQTGLSNTSYITTLTEFEYNGVSWKMNQWNPSTLQVKTNQSSSADEWRFYNTTAMPGKITKVVIKFSALTLTNTNTTGFKFVGGTSEISGTTGGTDGVWNASEKTLTWTPNTEDNFTYFALYQNGKVASGTNKLASQDAIVVTYENAGGTTDTIVKTLKSIAVEGMTTTYEQGDIFQFDGTCTATYSVTKNDEPQEDETKTVTPTVSVPNMNLLGTQTITVSYTDDEETVSTTYDITITENIVTPGTYTSNLNNVFFGCVTGNNATEQSGKFDDVLVVAGCKSTAQTKTSYQTGHVRFYADSYLTISVPTGYVIKSVVFTADGTWNGSITASAGTYTDGTKTWAGNAQEVKFSFAAQNRIKSIKVTYDVDVKYALNITTPSNGTLVVKDGSTVLADGAQVYEGTKLVVTPTPNAGYVFESLTVGGEAVELTNGTYTFNMPAAAVTISATFKENEKPAATLTLSKNGVTEDITGYKQDDKVILPSIQSDCKKAFVGWSADDKCSTEPEYKAGDEYTLASTSQTLYAVYATINGGAEATAANTLSSNGWKNETKYTSLQIDANVKAEVTGGSNSGKYYENGTNWRLYQNENATITISTTLGELKSVKFTFTNSNTGTFLYGSTTLTSGNAVEVSGTSATFTVGNSSESVTNGQIRISQIEVVYTGGVSYSDYSTICEDPVIYYTITATAENGSVEGAGEYEEGTEVTLTATAAEGYEFVNWTSGETEVSTANPFTFTVTSDTTLVANFKEVVKAIEVNVTGATSTSGEWSIDLAGSWNDQALTIRLWQDNTQGFGSYAPNADTGYYILLGAKELTPTTAGVYADNGDGTFTFTATATDAEGAIYNITLTGANPAAVEPETVEIEATVPFNVENGELYIDACEENYAWCLNFTISGYDGYGNYEVAGLYSTDNDYSVFGTLNVSYDESQETDMIMGTLKTADESLVVHVTLYKEAAGEGQPTVLNVTDLVVNPETAAFEGTCITEQGMMLTLSLVPDLQKPVADKPMTYELNLEKSSIQIAAGLRPTPLTLTSGEIATDYATPAAVATVAASLDAETFLFTINMTAAAAEYNVVIENATVTKNNAGYNIDLTGEWDGHTIKVEVCNELTDETILANFFIDGGIANGGDQAEGKVTATVSEGVVTIAGAFECPGSGNVYNVTISGKLPEGVSTDLENNTITVKAAKVIRNGQLIIRQGDVEFNAQGAIIK